MRSLACTRIDCSPTGTPRSIASAPRTSTLAYVQRRVFPGGCFFVAASAELGARPGQVHDLVARYQMEWRDLLEHEAREAHKRGELPGSDPAQLAFELGVILAGTNIVAVLHSDDSAIERARLAIHRRMASR